MKRVKTKEELKEAIKNKEDQIIIENEDLAKHVIKFKKIKKLSKWTLRILLAGIAAGGIGVALAPFTGGTSAVVGTAPAVVSTGIIASYTAASGATISTGAIIAIGALSILGIAILYALWKDYNIVVEGGGNAVAGKFKVRLMRK